jgi:hypothetical protein
MSDRTAPMMGLPISHRAAKMKASFKIHFVMTPPTIDVKTILDWCFVIGALNFSVFGFLYGVHSSVQINNLGHMGISHHLRMHCSIIAVLIFLLSIVAVWSARAITVYPVVWIFVGCLLVTSLLAAHLAYKMWTPKRPSALEVN